MSGSHGKRGGEIRLPLKTTSFKEWSQGLRAYAAAEILREEISYWERIEGMRCDDLPCDGVVPDRRHELVRTALFELRNI